ncbi:MAG: FAD-dependent oxidoreductase, partial [Mameliella sp.]|nr:FAD-dependent oxidoreductase [Phaeodactylibacter sp.]
KAIADRFATGVKMRFRQYSAGIKSVVNIVDLPNGKTDANNHHNALISTDLPEENWPWPSSGWAWRDRFAQRLKAYTLGFLWFCQNDEALPLWFRKDCRQWGLSRSEYQDNDHFPRQVYVREGRRLSGQYVFTANDVMSDNGDRPKVHPDSITSSHYALDSHACRKREPGKPLLEGIFSYQVKPFTVPFRIMVPKTIKNLLCPVPASASHVGFATLRMEPCWMALGQAAGVACGVMAKNNLTLPSIDYKEIQEELLQQQVKLIHYADVPVSHKYFKAIQQLGLTGKLIEWKLMPDDPITKEQAGDWCRKFGIPEIPIPDGCTRGAYLEMIHTKVI